MDYSREQRKIVGVILYHMDCLKNLFKTMESGNYSEASNEEARRKLGVTQQAESLVCDNLL